MDEVPIGNHFHEIGEIKHKKSRREDCNLWYLKKTKIDGKVIKDF